jgi:hypothetical protein
MIKPEMLEEMERGSIAKKLDRRCGGMSREKHDYDGKERSNE